GVGIQRVGYQVEQLRYFGLKGMGLFCHFQIDTKRLKRKLALFFQGKTGPE
ncbi:MAG: hypothetical protein RL650_2185, partial [Pseudomonadota bacterium]